MCTRILNRDQSRSATAPRPPLPHRRGLAMVQAALALPALFAFGALTVDIGRLYMAKNQLQVAADAAALAGASGYLTDHGLVSNLSDVLRRNNPEVQATVRQRAKSFCYRNTTFGDHTQLETQDMVLGTYDFKNPGAPLDTSGTRAFNAVQVTVRRTEGSTNGPVEFFFAKVFGRKQGGVTATATAVIDDRFVGYDPFQRNAMPLVPVAIQEDVYEYLLANGPDVYSFDDVDRTVHETGDAIGEVHLFPWKYFGNGDSEGMLETGVLSTDLSGEASGNFGFLDFGADSSNSSEINSQIVNGLSESEVQETIGATTFRFVDEDGSPNTYQLSGAPGMKVTTDTAFAERLGDVVGFFLFDVVHSDGTNAVYRITDIRFGRLMHVDLSGGPKNKTVVIQPTPYDGAGIWVDRGGAPTGGQVGRIVLAR